MVDKVFHFDLRRREGGGGGRRRPGYRGRPFAKATATTSTAAAAAAACLDISTSATVQLVDHPSDIKVKVGQASDCQGEELELKVHATAAVVRDTRVGVVVHLVCLGDEAGEETLFFDCE